MVQPLFAERLHWGLPSPSDGFRGTLATMEWEEYQSDIGGPQGYPERHGVDPDIAPPYSEPAPWEDREDREDEEPLEELLQVPFDADGAWEDEGPEPCETCGGPMSENEKRALRARAGSIEHVWVCGACYEQAMNSDPEFWRKYWYPSQRPRLD